MDPAGDDDASLTRRFTTAYGDVDYAQLSDLIAPHLESLLDRIIDGAFADQPYSDVLARDFHQTIVGEVVPDLAGRWRTEPVQIGNHVPPEHYLVPMLMREYGDNVQARLANATTIEHQLELLAYAEGQFLFIHPFADFNGRTVRALLRELLVRLDFPPLDVAVERGTPTFDDYRTALADFDNGRMELLIDFWVRRLEG